MKRGQMKEPPAKICSRCLDPRPIEQFSVVNGRSQTWCLACKRESEALRKAERLQAEKERRDNELFNQLMGGWPPVRNLRTQ